MAEAVAEERPQPSKRFYCHLCNVEVQPVNADFTCPLCSGGFIEELPASSAAVAEHTTDDVEMQEVNGLDDLDLIRDEIATLLMGREGSRPPEIEDDDVSDTITANLAPGTNVSAFFGGGGNSVDGSPSTSNGRIGIGGMIRRSRRRPRVQNFERFDNVIFEILQTLSGGNDGALGNASMFFMGNPGDYAWGREGIDTIVTQLLNQMDTTGPPPLPKEKIEEIPNVEITPEQVDQKLQCSVCWEDFKVMENVRKLPCLHVYHENCIVPWLELHGTCPICRKSLTPEGADVPSLRGNPPVYSRHSTNPDILESLNSGTIGGRLSSLAPATTDGTATTNNTQNATVTVDQSRSVGGVGSGSSGTSEYQSIPVSNIFASIPVTFSRLFSQPSTSTAMTNPLGTPQILTSSSMPPLIATAGCSAQPTASSSTTSSAASLQSVNREPDTTSLLQAGSSVDIGNSSSQTDVYKFEDGNVDYEFD